MIHLRQHLVNGFGQKVEKIKTYQGDLGSGIHDISGKEIFVNDIIEGELEGYSYYPVKGVVDFGSNGFFVVELETGNVYRLSELLPITVIGQKEKL